MKSKKFNVKGLAAGAFVTGLSTVGSVASAEEVVVPEVPVTPSAAVTTDNTATNNVDAQLTPSSENTADAVANQTTPSSGTAVVAPVESPELNKAVDAAENAGVVVETKPVETQTSSIDAAKQLTDDTTKIVEATNVQKSVDSSIAIATDAAKNAGVKITTDAPVVYTDDNAAAIADARDQTTDLTNATSAQNQADSYYDSMKKTGSDAGIVLTDTEIKEYTDYRLALSDIANQVTNVGYATIMQKDIDSAMAIAIDKARKAGLVVNVADKTGVTVATAKASGDSQVSSVEKAISLLNEANALIDKAVADAKASGTVVIEGGSETLPADKVSVRATEIANAVNKVVLENKAKVDAYNVEKAANDAEVARIAAENKAIAQRNADALAKYKAALNVNKADAASIDDLNAKLTAVVKTATDLGAKVLNQSNVTGKTAAEIKASLTNQIDLITKLVTEQKALNDKNAATHAQLKADYQTKLDAYNKALTDRANLVANDVSFEGYGKSEDLNALGSVTTDTVTVDGAGNFTLKEPQVDTDGTFGNINVTGKFIYTVTYDEATNKAIIKITGISLNTWQLDLTRQTTAVNRNISASYKDLAGNVLYTRNFDGLSSIGVQTINKSFALDKEIILSDGETSAELMFLKTEPKWFISAPSTLFAKLSYNTAPLPNKPIEPTLVTVDNLIGNTISYVLPVAPTPPPVEKELPLPTTEPEPPVLAKAVSKELIASVDVNPVQIEMDVNAVQILSTVHNVDIATSITPQQVTQTPTNIKSVANTDGTNIDRALVAKGSTVVWTLSDNELQAGRDIIKSIKRVDHLDSGYVLNLEASQMLNPNWVLVYDEMTHTLEATANPSVVIGVNSDLMSSYKLPDTKIVGVVVNDGATYQNTFITNIVTAETVISGGKGTEVPNGKTSTIKIVSNTPEVYTPGTPDRTENGAVIVRYWSDTDKGPIKIALNQVDVEDGKVGLAYDTSDHKDKFIAFEGNTYELTSKVIGDETGSVVRGVTMVDYYYKLVPLEENKGDVLIHYISEDFVKIASDVVDISKAPVGTSYTTTDHKPEKITTSDGVIYELVPNKTIGLEDGKVVEGTSEITYVYKRITPEPKTPTPTDNVIKPVKHILTKDGQQVDGRSLLPNSEVEYTYLWDLDQYKGMSLSKEDIAKGWGLIGDLSDKTVSLDFAHMSLKTSDYKDVTSDFELKTFESIDSVKDERVIAILNSSGIKPSGDFYVWMPKDVNSFVSNYVTQGKSIFANVPVTLGDYVGDFNNKVWQVDAGNGYYGNIVENNIPKLEAIKDVVKAIGSKESVANSNIPLGSKVPYLIDSPNIPGNLAGGIHSVDIIENFDEKYDKFDGEFYIFADRDIKLKDGTIIKKDEEITKLYRVIEHHNNEGVLDYVTLSVDKDFLESISEDSGFDSYGYFVTERIAAGEHIENTIDVIVNDYKVASSRVETNTFIPEVPVVPEKPETPVKPVDVKKLDPKEPVVIPTKVNPVKEVPVEKAVVLPETGDSSNVMFGTLAGVSFVSMAVLIKRRKKN